MGNKKSHYDLLSGKIVQLYKNRSSLIQEVNTRKKEFEDLAGFLGSWHFNHSFPVLESDLNNKIANWREDTSLTEFQELLRGIQSKIKSLDAEIPLLKKAQEELLHKPDRHGSKQMADKMALFLKNVQTIGLGSLDEVNDRIIPTLHTRIKEIQKGFAVEGNKVKRNQAEAKKLYDRINKCGQYVDRFGLRALCKSIKATVDQVINTPNYAHLEDDAELLKKANSQLDHCMEKYQEEAKEFGKVHDMLKSHVGTIWAEDYEVLDKELEKGPFHTPVTSKELESRLTALLPVKEREINAALAKYSKKVKGFFSSQIQNLKNKHTSRQDLKELVNKMEKKIADEKKRILYMVLKIVGISIAVILIIAGIAYAISEYGNYILAAVIIIGIGYLAFRIFGK